MLSSFSLHVSHMHTVVLKVFDHKYSSCLARITTREKKDESFHRAEPIIVNYSRIQISSFWGTDIHRISYRTESFLFNRTSPKSLVITGYSQSNKPRTSDLHGEMTRASGWSGTLLSFRSIPPWLPSFQKQLKSFHLCLLPTFCRMYRFPQTLIVLTTWIYLVFHWPVDLSSSNLHNDYPKK